MEKQALDAKQLEWICAVIELGALGLLIWVLFWH